MWLSSIFAAFIILNSYTNAGNLQKADDVDHDKLLYDKYVELDKNVKTLVNSEIKKVLPYVMEASEHLNLSSRCANNLFILMSGIKKLKLSAIKFLDAAGKIPPGLLTGTITMFGDYDECQSTEVLRNDGRIAFQGQYCMLDIKPVLPTKKGKLTIDNGFEDMVEHAKNTSEIMQFILSKIHFAYVKSIKYGLCVPSGCAEEDVAMILNYFGEKAFVRATVDYCDQQQKLQMHPGMIAAICFFSVAGLLVIVGSAMDCYSRERGISLQMKTARFLLCFSIPTNFQKVISTKTQDSTLTSIFGIRTLSLFYIILAHQYFFWGMFSVNGHAILFQNSIPKFFTQIAINGFLTVDVFFFLGGLLNTYTRTKIQESGKHQPTTLQILIHRLWRIYPTYVFSMLTYYLFVNVRGLLGVHVRQDFIESCDSKWWKNLLFINNFLYQDKVCMPHTWYIAVDMQLFLISLLTVPVLLKNARMGIILHMGVLIVGLLTTTLWALYKHLMPSILIYYSDFDEVQKVRNAYTTTFPHISLYFTGLITGYVLSKWNQFKISTTYRLIGWPTAAICLISMLFYTKRWNSGVEFTMIESVLFFTFSRLVYVLAVVWIVVCCARGYGGVINYILSLKIWIPFSRISYMVYMISPALQLHYYGSLKMRIDVDYMTLIWRHIGDLGVSCLMGLAMVVIIESPFISMEKLLFHKSPLKKESPSNNTENPEKYIEKDEITNQIELDINEKNINGIIKEIELEKNDTNWDGNI